MINSKSILTVMAARNGWTVKTRSGTYLCSTIDQLVKQIKSHALVLLREAQKDAEPSACNKNTQEELVNGAN